MITGSGRTIDVSSIGISFVADSQLTMEEALEVSINWPVPRNAVSQLTMTGTVVRTEGNKTALKIRSHEFRTRSLGSQLARSRRFGG